jgi:AraC-like DNA-binding protein/mannose-6-phosphate isomerase-like protein (cupin superfamily)
LRFLRFYSYASRKVNFPVFQNANAILKQLSMTCRITAMILQQHSTFTQRVYPAGAPLPAEPEFYLGHMGKLKSNGNFLWEQKAEGVSIHAVHQGEGTVWCDGSAHEVRAGDLFVFLKGHTYRYSDTPAAPWKYTYFSLCGQRAEECMELAGFTASRSVRSVPLICPFRIRLRNVSASFEKGAMTGVSPVRAAWELTEALAAETVRPPAPNRETLAETARRLIESAPQPLVNVNDLAEALGVSRTTLFRSFRERYGLPVKAFIEQVRFVRVEPLLKNPAVSIHEAARLAGYSDPLYFSRVFRRRYGIPPAEWRKQKRTANGWNAKI